MENYSKLCVELSLDVKFHGIAFLTRTRFCGTCFEIVSVVNTHEMAFSDAW